MKIHDLPLLLLTLYLTERCVCDVTQWRFSSKPEFSDKIANNISKITISLTRSITVCASHCGLVAHCSSIFYLHVSRTCQLNLQSVQSTDLQPSAYTKLYFNNDLKVESPFHVSCSPTMTRNESVIKCRDMGKRLAITDTVDKLLALRSFILNDDSTESEVDYYLDATRSSLGADFYWSNGVVLSLLPSPFWREYEPGNGNEMCITFAPDYLNGRLNDDSCDTPRCYVCESL